MTYTYRPAIDDHCAEDFPDYYGKDFSEVEADRLLMQLRGRESTYIIEPNRRKPLEITGAIAKGKNTPPSVAEFQGRYLLIDLWATWCAPCRAEMPFLAELRKKYPTDELAILSISLDKEKDLLKWEAAVAELQMDWSNWIIFNGTESEFSSAYTISTLPRYFIVDPQGRVVNDQAPRPSDPALTDMLDHLLAMDEKR